MSSVYPPYGGMQSVPCQRCHAPLLSNEATCRNCGYYNAPAQGNNPAAQGPSSVSGSWSEGTPQPSYGQNQSQYGPPVTPPAVAPQQRSSGLLSGGQVGPQAGPVSQAPYGMPPVAPQQRSLGLLSGGRVGPQAGPVSQVPYGAPSASPVSQVPYGMPPAGSQQFGAPTVPVQQFSGTGPFDASRTQMGSPQSFPGGMVASSSPSDSSRFTQPPLQKSLSTRRIKPWMIALIVLLVIVLVGGAFVGYTFISKPNNATPTNVASSAPKDTALFADTFKNNANGWSLAAYPNSFSISLANGSLVLEDDSHELLWEPLPGNKTFSDFTLAADAMLSKGDQTNGYGFYIRGASAQNSQWTTYYRFELYGDGSYAIFKGTLDANGNSTSAKLVNYTLTSAIHKRGIINHVSITAKGSSLSLMVNGQLVKMLTDTSYTNGAIAPFVSNLQNAKLGAQARFSNLTISAT